MLAVWRGICLSDAACSKAQFAQALAEALDRKVDGKYVIPETDFTIPAYLLRAFNLTPGQANSVRSLLHGCSLAVIARKTSTANGLKGADLRDEFQGKSKAARRLNLAVQHLPGGEPREAFRIIETELCRVVLGDERASADTLRENGISSAEWRAAIFRILRTATQSVVGESWNEWVGRAKEAVKTAAESLRWADDGIALRSYMICTKTGNTIRAGLLDVAAVPV